MSRQLRNFSQSKIYHIIIKGIDDSDIFFSNKDRTIFINKIKLVQEKFPFQVYAYCLMSNHIHMVLKVENNLLSKSMQSLSQRYSHYFNSSYNRKGTLFQDRFYSRNVENKKYFLDVCKYVHKNPEKAHISLASEYPWSSYQEYIGKEKIIDKNILLSYFNNNIYDFIKFTTKNETIDEIISCANFEMNARILDDELIMMIIELCNLNGTDEIFDYFKIVENRKILSKFKDIKEISISQLSRITRVNKKAIKSLLQR